MIQASNPARDPQDLERLLIDRQHVGDVDGMVALFEPQAVVDCGESKFLHGHPEIRRYFTELVAAAANLRAACSSRR